MLSSNTKLTIQHHLHNSMVNVSTLFLLVLPIQFTGQENNAQTSNEKKTLIYVLIINANS